MGYNGNRFLTARFLLAALALALLAGHAGAQGSPPADLRLVEDLEPGIGASSWTTQFVNPRPEIRLTDRLLFEADPFGPFWISEGPSLGARPLGNFPAGNFLELQEAEGHYFFRWEMPDPNFVELVVSDGTQEGTFLFNPNPKESLDPRLGGGAGGIYYFAGGTENNTNRELFRYHPGVDTQPVLLANLNPAGGSNPKNWTPAGDHMTFEATTPGTFRSLCVTDGTAAGTHVLLNQASEKLAAPSTLLQTAAWGVGSEVVILGEDAASGVELRRVIAGSAMTEVLLESAPGAASALHWSESFQGVLLVATDGGGGLQDLVAIDPGSGTSETLLDGGSPVRTQLFSLPRSGRLAWSTADRDLWTTDGTLAGTRNETSGALPPDTDFVRTVDELSDGTLVFWVQNLANEYSLWATDGTAAGTVLLKDSNLPRFPRPLGAVPEQMLFFAEDPASGGEPWVSDGTVAGTHRLLDLTPGPASTDFLLHCTSTAGKAVFGVLRPNNRWDLWVTDGTAGGTAYSGERFFQGFPQCAAWQDSILIHGWSLTHGYEVFVSDGAVAGTRILEEVGIDSSVPRDMIRLGETVLFWAGPDDGDGELYKSDGTAGGTEPINPALPGPRTALQGADQLFALGPDLALASMIDGLYRTDGTAEGTTQISPVRTYRPTVLGNGTALFMDFDSASRGWLWTSDGTPAGTQGVLNLHSAWLEPFVLDTGEQALFVGGTNSNQLWASDGTLAGTGEVSSLLPGFRPGLGGISYQLLEAGDWIFMLARDGSLGTEVWRMDPDSYQTFLVADMNPGPADWRAFGLCALGDVALYGIDTELWRFRVGEPPQKISDNLGPYPRTRDPLGVDLGDRCVFLGASEAHGAELWTTDGTVEGTQMLVDSVPGPGSLQSARHWGTKDGFAYITGTEGVVSQFSYRTNGTPEGTRRLVAPPELNPLEAVPVGRELLVSAASLGLGTELWSTTHLIFEDGFEGGTLTPWSGGTN